MTISPKPITSRSLRQIAKQFAAGRHSLVTGSVGDLVLLQGQILDLADAVEVIGRPTFDVVLRLNGADPMRVLKGEEALAQINAGRPAEDGTASLATVPAREQRLARIRAGTGEDQIAALRRYLTQCEFSVLAVFEQADIVLKNPAHHDETITERVAGLQLALRDAAHAGRYRNTCVLLAGDRSAVPSVLLAGCEDIMAMELGAPTRDERVAFLRAALPRMAGADRLTSDAARDDVLAELASLTDGETLRSLGSLADYSCSARDPVLDPKALVNHHRVGDSTDYWSHVSPRMLEILRLLENRVFGQPKAIAAALRALATEAMGVTTSSNKHASEAKPPVLIFVGPTGVGKTELVKVLAEAVFNDPEAYFRIDMSTFGQEHSAERLTGSPPGYVGFERGGELTNAVRRRPFQVILLDEIEKAHPLVMDRFMSIFDDGRVADAQGHLTYFSNVVFIATSNIGGAEVTRLAAESGGDLSYEMVEATSQAAVERYFEQHNRREIYGRIKHGVVAFDLLRPETVERIALRIVESASFRRGPRLLLDAGSSCEMAKAALADPKTRLLGGRQVNNVFTTRLGDLASWLSLHGHAGAAEVRVVFRGLDMYASVDGSAATLVA